MIKFRKILQVQLASLNRECKQTKTILYPPTQNHLMYKLLFSRGFYFHEFCEPDPRENFHFNSCLFIVMTTSEKS